MAEVRMVIDEGDEIFHATSSHEGLEVEGARMNQVQQICTPCNSWKGLPNDLGLYADFTISSLITPTVLE